MRESYQLSAGTLLYSVCRLHKSSIYGVPNVMPKMSDKEFPAFAQAAETELMEKGYGTLNFDGEFVLEEGFAALLDACADCTAVVGASLRRGGAWEKYTFYPRPGAVLTRAEDYTCTLRPADSLSDELLSALALSGAEEAKELEPLEEVLCDTDILERRDRAGLLAEGVKEAQADLILASLAGTGGYAHIVRVEERKCTAELLLLYGVAGILQAAAEYSETQEFLRLTPVAAEAITAQVKELFRTATAVKEKEGA